MGIKSGFQSSIGILADIGLQPTGLEPVMNRLTVGQLGHGSLLGRSCSLFLKLLHGRDHGRGLFLTFLGKGRGHGGG